MIFSAGRQEWRWCRRSAAPVVQHGVPDARALPMIPEQAGGSCGECGPGGAPVERGARVAFRVPVFNVSNV